MQATLQYRKGGSHSLRRVEVSNNLNKWERRMGVVENQSPVLVGPSGTQLYVRNVERGYCQL